MKNSYDRGLIKWQPFNSCFNQELAIKDIYKFKNRKYFPTLSEDQLEIISNRILESYNLKLIVNIEYYYDGDIKNVNGKINLLDTLNKKIYLNKQVIYLNQILKIKVI